MIVVDTNILVYLHISSEWSGHATRLLQKDPSWVSPPLWRSEFRNVLAGYLRKGIVSLEYAKQIMTEALKTMNGHEIPVSSNRVLELTSSSSCTAYDCEFVALAQDLGVRLVTADTQILANFPSVAINLEQFIGESK